MSTGLFINNIQNNVPFVYAKFGDGEYLCMIKYDNKEICKHLQTLPLNANCDNDNYTEKLSLSLRESLKYLVDTCKNSYIGEWPNIDVRTYIQSLITTNINFCQYGSFLFTEVNNIDDKINIFKIIKTTQKKKIYVCNELLIKVKSLLNIDHLVHVSINNWFDTQLDNVMEQIKKIIGNEDKDYIILTSCGMGAKVLIAELHKIYPKSTYIDIGSGLDIICTKRNSRGWQFKYEDLYKKFLENDFIPEDWNDPKYDYIYPEAHNKLGIHVSKDI